MPGSVRDPNDSKSPPGASTDPFVTIYREHTELQVLAERFRQVSDALDRGEATARTDAAEGVEVHQRFLVQVHQRREALLSAEVRASVDAALREAFTKCAVEHPTADRFAADARECLREPVLSVRSAHRLAALFREEADRVVEHHRWENEHLYHPLRPTLSAETLQRIANAVRPLDGDAASAQVRLSAWSSHLNASAD